MNATASDISKRDIELLKTIIRDHGMSTRPSYYSGRGATTADLNSRILFGIHGEIYEIFGGKAAEAFVDMVAKIKILSATTFIDELYKLFHNNWIIKAEEDDAPGVAADKDNPVCGFIGINMYMNFSPIDQTQSIRNRFLMVHGRKYKKEYLQNGIIHTYWGE